MKSSNVPHIARSRVSTVLAHAAIATRVTVTVSTLLALVAIATSQSGRSLSLCMIAYVLTLVLLEALPSFVVLTLALNSTLAYCLALTPTLTLTLTLTRITRMGEEMLGDAFSTGCHHPAEMTLPLTLSEATCLRC